MNLFLRRSIHAFGISLALSVLGAFPVSAADTPGALESAGGETISGWVSDSSDGVTIELKITDSEEPEDMVLIQIPADQPRADLEPAAGSSARGFSYDIDWEEYEGDSFTITAEALFSDGRVPLEGTIVYTKSTASSKRTVSSDESEDSGSDSNQGGFIGTFVATGYCSCSRCSGGHSLTYSGTVPKAGHTIAADPDVFPIGTRLVIGETVYTVEDIGNSVTENHLDIYFGSHQDALDFGRQKVEVYAAA